jgi:hypothetical protein
MATNEAMSSSQMNCVMSSPLCGVVLGASDTIVIRGCAGLCWTAGTQILLPIYPLLSRALLLMQAASGVDADLWADLFHHSSPMET